MKAMLLAAGEGRRLRPLTETTHKALLPIGNTCLIEMNLRKLQQAGIHDIIINVSYLADQLMHYLGDGSRYGVRITYSIEADGCLGTGGGIHRALPFLGDEPFWVLSADVWSDFPLPAEKLLDEAMDGYLVMVPNPSYHPEGDFGIALENGRLNFSDPKYTFANISFLRPQIFARYTGGIFELGAVFRDLIRAGCAYGEIYAGPWFNVGTEVELNAVRQGLGGV